jgi:cytochrome c-type biogenesis protein CcmH
VFWTFAAGALLIAALITFRPLLRVKSLWQPLALALVFLVPAAALWMYTGIGTPEGIGINPPKRAANAAGTHAPDSQEMSVVVDGLRNRLAQNPEDLEGWVLLARTLKTMQQFEEAHAALEKALAIAPQNPMVMVELAEAKMYRSRTGTSQAADELLNSALAIDPSIQKAHWLLGVSSAQSGDFATAVGHWETLLTFVEPGSAVAQSVQSQIDDARARGGVPEQPVPTPAGAEEAGGWPGLDVAINMSPQAAEELPPGGVLYVMVRPAGMNFGPPIGVRRIVNPRFPVRIAVNDGDSMMQERLISSQPELQLSARVSRSGTPAAQSGDWQSASIVVPLNTSDPVELVLDQRID